MNEQNVVHGVATVLVSGATQNVEVGFEPSYIKCQNITDIDIYEHHNPGPGGGSAMADDYAVLTTASTGVVTVATSAGITPLAGRTAGAAITGTATVTDGSTTVTGSGTNFSGDLVVGDSIKINGQTVEVASITSKTVLIADKAFTAASAAAGASVYDMVGKGGGFTMGTGICTTAAELVYWEAHR